MIAFTLKRALSGVVTLFVVSALTFLLLYSSSGNVARQILGQGATSAQVSQKEAELGLDQSVVSRYIQWLDHAVRGDFGDSWFSGQPVAGTIEERLPITLSVVLVALAVAACLAALLGVVAAVHRGWVDRAVQLLSIGGAAIPQFLVAILLVSVLAVQLHWFPATGYVGPTVSVSAWAASITLPVIALAVGSVAGTAQQVRSAVIDSLAKDYVRTLRSRGLSDREILLRHVLRDAAPAALTVLSVHFIGMLGGVVILEQIFALGGLGNTALTASIQGDMPMLMGVVIYLVLLVVIVNLLTDLAVAWLKPKARTA